MDSIYYPLLKTRYFHKGEIPKPGIGSEPTQPRRVSLLDGELAGLWTGKPAGSTVSVLEVCTLPKMPSPDTSVKNPPAIQGTPVPFLGQEDPLEKG